MSEKTSILGAAAAGGAMVAVAAVASSRRLRSVHAHEAGLQETRGHLSREPCPVVPAALLSETTPALEAHLPKALVSVFPSTF